MQIEHQFPCSAVQFFNFMARRIAQDIQIETDKKLTIAEIHQGMKYDKKVLVSEKKQRIGKAQVATCSCSIHYIIWIKLFFFFTCAKIIIYRSQEYLKWHLNVEKSFLIFLKPFFNGETHLHFS